MNTRVILHELRNFHKTDKIYEIKVKQPTQNKNTKLAAKRFEASPVLLEFINLSTMFFLLIVSFYFQQFSLS